MNYERLISGLREHHENCTVDKCIWKDAGDCWNLQAAAALATPSEITPINAAPQESETARSGPTAVGHPADAAPNATPQPPVTPHRSMPGGSESSYSANGDNSRQPCETGSGDKAACVASSAGVQTFAVPSLDAARYRWLNRRDNFLIHIDDKPVRLKCGDVLDKWIDAEMAKETANLRVPDSRNDHG